MKKSYRVKREKDFQAIFDGGESTANRKFVIYFLNEKEDQNHFRLGISVGKRLGNAVTRNAVKRKIRHVIMEFSESLKPTDFVIIARKGVEELEYQEVRQNLKHVLKLAHLLEEGFESEETD
ncbi:ribonuclease P protein component [Streptococcus parauberis]|uniref:Ribonuclease P protein component n=3 Tax=Streptococcus parauberis TaxID=1348 RepID=A0A0E2UAN5_9STRE|nr:ribonuclease P protein component [Streptococcus parauberis]AEF26139.1 ribonuclease P protein component [Streptococcus parauberis KCTC 11537]AUT04954.1 Ribonuclease P [Streptococcus parauberis]EGE55112.1 ribonuclease P protein component [Streptococcus parauberis NCFD 2020]EMF48617.1 Ribonuclease P protein component [Streptococcus parauberis KRS-02109]EMG25045.1 Ribonuclease P protein component [Streptococcus parauberis KRS-02083]